MKTLEEKLRLIVSNSKMGAQITHCESAGYEINSRGNQYSCFDEYFSGFHKSIEECANEILEMMDKSMVSEYGDMCKRIFLV